ncbi:HNH endonuclease [Paraburkholderia sp. Tr-20389]|uniref:HNH endonuclease signature motif containing protein n=1 Tax=Paraburkholderia sp. Tr-20389 TaxID=2703903 RepID=UPI00198134C3|nr:HNH endonuclease signature motif containing protein [Paraburkholderia sp. Tr-20389]MBN3757172.1 HNH endonuclease [Paraburkholderia sp. Tr-20389]
MSNALQVITQERLKDLLSYDPETGIFTWRHDHFSATAGMVAGSRAGKQYIRVRVDGRGYYAHRLAVLYMTGELPPRSVDVDHIDLNGRNNRWLNLRCVPHATNLQNQREKGANRKNPSSRLLGVSWKRDKAKWVAVITVNGTQKHLGYFDDEQVAHKAYITAKRNLHPGNTL